MYIIDDGKSMLSQAGRVHTEYERQGNFKQLSQYCNSAAKEYGCSRRVALVETTLNRYARSERFRKTHKEIATKVTCFCPTIHRYPIFSTRYSVMWPGRVAQSVGRLTRKSGVLGSIPGLATCFRFSFRFFKKGSCQLLAKVCARSTG